MTFLRSVLGAALCAIASTAWADTALTGVQQCRSTLAAPVPVGDRPAHAYAIATDKCEWTKPVEIAGLAAKDGTDTLVVELDGSVSSERGYYVGTMSNGDTFVVRFVSTSLYKSGKPAGTQGSWRFYEGRGKLKGLQGGGNFKSAANADGTSRMEVTGTYTLP
jgi:hypothetical protein